MTNLNEAPSVLKSFREKTSHIANKVDNRVTDWQMTASDLLAKFDWHSAGSGKYGLVFRNPAKSYVLKVFMRDTAYLRWVNFSMKHPHNPYVPKFRGKVIRITNLFMAVRIEKLRDIDPENDKYYELVYMRSKPSKDPYVTEIHNFFKQNEHLLDLHSGNVMMRGAIPVIIDPFYSWFDPSTMKFSIDPDDLSGLEDVF